MREAPTLAMRVVTALTAASLFLLPSESGGAPPPAPAPKAVGINAAIRNQVRIRSGGTGQPNPAVLKARVMLNDEVRTGPASQLQILLLDRTTFTVGANARVAVDRFAFDPATNLRSTGISVARGAFRFMSGRVLGHPGGPANVHTPAASIGIRGTIFEGAVGPDAIMLAHGQPALQALNLRPDAASATFIVLRGPGANTTGDTRPGAIDVTAGGQTITLDRAGMAVFVPAAGQPPIGPFDVSFATLAALQPLLRTAPAVLAAVGESARQGPGTGGTPGSTDGTARRSFAGLLLGAIPAVILGLFAATRGNDGTLPTSP